MVKRIIVRGIKKKITNGPSKNYITRNEALKKLQIHLSDFRHLCILKGIFPKDPPRFFKGLNKTYYLKKDIQLLSNEEILRKFREIKAYSKKIIKAKKKNEKFDLKKLEENKPFYTLDKIIKERYPRFIDALHDLSDALCLMEIFSNFPKYELLKIDEKKVFLCKKYLREFYLYNSVCLGNIKKGFISIKGIYINVEIKGENIVWLVPYNFPQKMSFEIDYEIMNNFLELYLNLMKFVNFKLFKEIGLKYPPPEENSDLPFFGFNSLNLKSFQEKIEDNNNNKNNEENIIMESEEINKIKKIEEENLKIKNLFKNYVFFIGREIQCKEIFQMIIQSCGGIFCDESEYSCYNSENEHITHFITDRPENVIDIKKNKEYVQPQWIFDSLNNRKLMPTSDYFPGKKLPPHFSPFYEVDEKGDYVYDNNEDNEEDINEEEDKKELTKEEKELREMMMTNNKKKLLAKIREEAQKKKKQKVKTIKNKKVSK